MNEANSAAIEERLARLERGVKRSKRTATATMVLLVSLIAWSAAARSGKAHAAGSGAGDLVARSLTIVDEKGTSRVFLGLTNGPIVQLYDEKGTVRVVLGIIKDVPNVALTDENGHPRVILGVSKGPIVQLYDEKGISRVALGVSKDAPAGVVVADENGHPRVALGVNKDAPPTVELFDEKGKIIWTAP